MIEPAAAGLMQDVAHQHLFNQFWLTLFFVLPMVFVSRAVHPLVFFLFGRAMEGGGDMPRAPVYALALVGIVGMGASLLVGSA